MKNRVIVNNRVIVEMAFISGVTPNLIIEYTFKGNVVDPTPEVKKAIIKSSQEIVNAKSAPAITPGIIKGRVI